MTSGDQRRPTTGADIRRAREAANLTQTALAGEVGATPSWIKQLEARGDDPVPTASRYVPDIEIFLGLRPAPRAGGAGEDAARLSPELIERALREADDVALVAETARRMAYRRTHDQRNVAAFEVRGMPERGRSDDDTGTPPA